MLKRRKELAVSSKEGAATVGSVGRLSSLKAQLPGRRQSGIALILVIFIVALASIIVTSAAYSTHLASRRSSIVSRSVRAEYLLKSAVNVARFLLKEDKTVEDSAKDLWGKFLNGVPIPGELIGIDEPNVRVELEIRPEDSKIPLRMLTSGGTANTVWRDALVRLFQNLGFDQDQQVDQTGLLGVKVPVSPEKMVAILIDYADADSTEYNDPGFETGFEGPAGKELFPNRNFTRLSELSGIPGFTPARLQKLSPFISAEGIQFVNVNTAPVEVLRALSPNIDEAMASRIVEFREAADGPITGIAGGAQSLETVVGSSIASEISALTRVSSKRFQVIAKVDYDTSTYFLRAVLSRTDTGELPTVDWIELF